MCQTYLCVHEILSQNGHRPFKLHLSVNVYSYARAKCTYAPGQVHLAMVAC